MKGGEEGEGARAMRTVGGLWEPCRPPLTAPSLIAAAAEVARWLLRHENTSHESRYEKHTGMARVLE